MDVEQELKKSPDESLVEDTSVQTHVDPKAERRLVRKQDAIIIPLLFLGFFFGYLV